MLQLSHFLTSWRSCWNLTSQAVMALLKRDHGIEVEERLQHALKRSSADSCFDALARQRGISLPAGQLSPSRAVERQEVTAGAASPSLRRRRWADAWTRPRLVKTISRQPTAKGLYSDAYDYAAPAAHEPQEVERGKRRPRLQRWRERPAHPPPLTLRRLGGSSVPAGTFQKRTCRSGSRDACSAADWCRAGRARRAAGTVRRVRQAAPTVRHRPAPPAGSAPPTLRLRIEAELPRPSAPPAPQTTARPMVTPPPVPPRPAPRRSGSRRAPGKRPRPRRGHGARCRHAAPPHHRGARPRAVPAPPSHPPSPDAARRARRRGRPPPRSGHSLRRHVPRRRCGRGAPTART